MSTVIIQIGRGVIIAEASSQQAGQALLNFFTEAVTGAANTFNNYQDAQALYDQIAAWGNNSNAQEAAKVITSSAFGGATTILLAEYGVGTAVIGGAAAAAGVLLIPPAIMSAAVVVGAVAAGYYAGKYYEYIFDELNRRGEIIGQTAYDILNPYPINPATNTDWSNGQNYVPPPPRRDPLVLDLNGNGLETIGINPLNPILFDHDGDGIKQSTGWIAPSDGLLVMDKNGNGTIDNGRELFGDATLKSNGQLASDGFDALADLDSNHDGVVNALDANFANLRVWQDTNQDGISQAGELFTLTQKGIVSFNVANVAHSQVLPNGSGRVAAQQRDTHRRTPCGCNQVADLGSYTKSDGSLSTLGNVTGSLADVNLASNPFYSQFTDTIPLSAAVQTLPDMQSAGMVRDLREAANDAVFEMRRVG